MEDKQTEPVILLIRMETLIWIRCSGQAAQPGIKGGDRGVLLLPEHPYCYLEHLSEDAGPYLKGEDLIIGM